MTSLSWQSLFNYLIRVGDCLSQLLNVMVFLGDNPNESLSSRAHRLNKVDTFWTVMRWIINTIFFWQGDHCLQAYLADRERAKRLLGHA